MEDLFCGNSAALNRKYKEDDKSVPIFWLLKTSAFSIIYFTFLFWKLLIIFFTTKFFFTVFPEPLVTFDAT